MKNALLNSIGLPGIAILMLLFSGCFNERSPIKPDENTTWVSPTEPNILLENLKKAISSLDLNNFSRCLNVEKFSFRADPNIAANNLGLFSNWRWESENQYFNNLRLAALPLNLNNNLTFLNPRINNFTQDSLEFTADYNLAIYHQDPNFKAVNLSGLATLQLKRNRQNEWQIITWQDNKTKTTTCWTELRQHFFAP